MRTMAIVRTVIQYLDRRLSTMPEIHVEMMVRTEPWVRTMVPLPLEVIIVRHLPEVPDMPYIRIVSHRYS